MKDSVYWQRVRAAFEAAVEQPLSVRLHYVNETCSTDEEIRGDLLRLLEADRQMAGFLSAPAVVGTEGTSGETKRRRARGYSLEEVIGEGGMALVYRARRERTRDLVAVKVIRRTMASADLIRRFHRERQILATFEHDSMAALLDSGVTDDGLPFVVMEFVDGIPINRYCHERRTTIPEILQLFHALCLAIEHAHERGVIHRDLKPDNILISPDGTVNVLDFGIAKILETQRPDVTLAGYRVLTPAYASPEQLAGSPTSVRSDVYSLGLLLKEILLGVDAGDEMLDSTCAASAREERDGETGLARETTARLGPRIPRVRDVQGIIRKALSAAPDERYSSVGDLRHDLSRWHAGRPVVARPRSVFYVLGLFLRRTAMRPLYAARYFTRAMYVRVTAGRTVRDVTRLAAWGWDASVSGRWSEAREFFAEALRTGGTAFEACASPAIGRALAASCNRFAIACATRGDFRLATRLFRRALEVDQALLSRRVSDQAKREDVTGDLLNLGLLEQFAAAAETCPWLDRSRHLERARRWYDEAVRVQATGAATVPSPTAERCAAEALARRQTCEDMLAHFRMVGNIGAGKPAR